MSDRVLDDDAFFRLYDCACEAGFASHRDVLLSEAFRNRVHSGVHANAQLMADLAALNESSSVHAGKLPLAVYLEKAVRLTTPTTAQREVFSQVLARCAALAAVPTPVPTAPSRRSDVLTVRFVTEGPTTFVEHFVDGTTSAVARARVVRLPSDGTDGDRLLDALLPAADREAISRTVLGDEWFARHRLRVRIVQNHPLAGRPWSETATNGRKLREHSDWTFELCPGLEPGPSVVWPGRRSVLVLCDATTRAEADALRSKLVNRVSDFAKDEMLRVEDRPEHFLQTVEESRANVFVVAGAAAEGWEALEAVLTQRHDATPRIAWVRAEAGHVPRPTAAFLRAVRALVITEDAGPEGVARWLSTVTLDEHDPVSAAHRASTGRLPVAWRVYADFASWSAAPVKVRDYAHPRVALDRTRQRGQAHARLKATMNDPERRALALVAVGGPSNCLHDLAPHLIKHVAGEGIPTNHLPVRLPPLRGNATQLRSQLDRAIREAAGAAANSTLANLALALRDAATSGADGPAVLWLDFGVCAAPRPLLLGADLTAWLESVQALVSHAAFPEDLRVVAFLAQETDRHREIADLVVRFEGSGANAALGTEVLDEVTRVERKDLLHFFRDKNHSSLDPGRAAELTELLLDAYDGQYEATTANIRRGELEGWDPLVRHLRAVIEERRRRSPST